MAVDSILYAGLCFSQVLTFAAYVVVTAGAALLQDKANNLAIWNGLNETEAAGLTAAYNSIFANTNYIQPYPHDTYWQFQYQWWIIEFELFVFLLTAACTIFPSIIPRLRPVALTFIASALVLVMDNVNAVFYLLRHETAKAVYDEYRIETVQAGLMMVGIANWMTIIFLGAYQPKSQQEQAQGKDQGVTVSVSQA